jgi:hypothetical protein
MAVSSAKLAVVVIGEVRGVEEVEEWPKNTALGDAGVMGDKGCWAGPKRTKKCRCCRKD